ncbi:MAG: peptidoglycan DD-metalloendopeptidase family protein [Clostridia bacterium]|nr:peptidoglycan DD-metalloendopeptidase family protein [Clostridia bacterium]
MDFKNPFLGGFKVTSPYGERTLNGKTDFHRGLDIVGLKTKEVRAVIGGRVLTSQIITDRTDLTWQWGNYICILGDDGNCIYYCHLDSRAAVTGQRVEKGDIIGIMGNTGYSFGAHTHFEVRKSDRRTAIDPAEYLGIPNAAGEYDIEKTSVSPWAEEAIKWAVDTEIMKGSIDAEGQIDFRPKENCTREEVAVFLHRFYEHMKGEFYD